MVDYALSVIDKIISSSKTRGSFSKNFGDRHFVTVSRDFAHGQKLAVFRRDNQICQVRIKFDGVSVEWDDWHCDHKVAWSKGATTVENGQVVCPACNLAKGAD